MQTQSRSNPLAPGTYLVAETANDKQPSDYLKVVFDGQQVEVLVGGKPLTEVADPAIVLWAAQVVPQFLVTGELAPIPGGSVLAA